MPTLFVEITSVADSRKVGHIELRTRGAFVEYHTAARHRGSWSVGTYAQPWRVGVRGLGTWEYFAREQEVVLVEPAPPDGVEVDVVRLDNVENQWLWPRRGGGQLFRSAQPAFRGPIEWHVRRITGL